MVLSIMIQAYIDLSLCSLGLYLTSLWGEFLFDDTTGFSTDKNVMAGNWRKLIPGHWRTLTQVSYAASVRANLKVFRNAAHPFFFHLFNIQLHAVNGLFLYLMLSGYGYSHVSSLFGALIFVAHPLCVNAVANISGRSSVLSGTFYFMALALAASNHFGLALICVLPALWAKEDTITLPLVLGGMALMADHPAWWVFFAVPLMVVAFTWKKLMHMRKRTGATEMVSLGFDPPMEPHEYHVAAMVSTILLYPAWVLGMSQNIDHDIKPAPRKEIIGAVTIVAMGVAFFLLFPQIRLALILMAVSPLIVYWFIVLPDPIAEHRAYVSVASVSFLGADLFSRTPFWVAAPLFAYFFICAIYRQHAWSDGLRLWTQAFEDGSQKKVRVLSNLNWAYQARGDLKTGEYWAREALKLKPNLFPVRFNLSRIAEDCGKMQDAIAIMEDTVRVTPIWQAHKRLGQLYEMIGNLDGALDQYLKVLEFQSLGPDTMDQKADTMNQVGSIYFRQVKPNDALPYFMKAHERDPKNAAIMYNIGMSHVAMKDKPEARVWLEKMGPNPPVPGELKELCKV